MTSQLARFTRTSRGLRTVRTGYAYQPPACCTYRRLRAACPSAPRTVRTAVRVPASGVPCVRVPRHPRSYPPCAAPAPSVDTGCCCPPPGIPAHRDSTYHRAWRVRRRGRRFEPYSKRRESPRRSRRSSRRCTGACSSLLEPTRTSITYGYSLCYTRLQPLLRAVTASITHGYSLDYIRLQTLLHAVTDPIACG